MDEPRHALEAARQIAGFDVYELPGGGWRAIYKHDPTMTLDHADWIELAWLCIGARMAAELREAAEELAARMAEPGRSWRTNGPGSGINV